MRRRGGNGPLEVLGGTALRVYLLLARSDKPLGVREVQRIMGFKSPSTAKHHLDRLVELGLVSRTSQGYVVKEGVEKVFEGYVALLGSFVPRLIPYAAFLTGSITTYLVLSWPEVEVLPVALGYLAALFLWVEGLRMYKWLKRLLR